MAVTDWVAGGTVAGTTEQDFYDWLSGSSPNLEVQPGSFSFVGTEVSMMVRNLEVVAISQGSDVISVTDLPLGLLEYTSEIAPNFSSVAYFPSTLQLFNANGANFTTLPSLPPSVADFQVNESNLSQVEQDRLATEFLQGTLPKGKWRSANQDTAQQVSAPLQVQIIANTTTAPIF